MNIDELDGIVLKNILTNKKHGLDFSAESNEKIFAPELWLFLKLTLEYIRVYKDLPTKKVLLERNKKNATRVNYLNDVYAALDPVQVDEREYKHYFEQLKSRFSHQLVHRLKDTLTKETEGDLDIKKSISEIHATLNHIRGVNSTKAYGQQTVKEALKEFRENYSAKLNNPEFGVGIKTGIAWFDFITSGLSRDGGELVIVGSETNGGKSMLLLNMAYNMWMGENKPGQEGEAKLGEDVLFFSLEMSHQECMQRLMARGALVPQFSIRDATLKPEEIERLGKSTKFISEYGRDFHIIDMPRDCTMSAIEAIYNDIVATSGRKPKVVVIDYLSLMGLESDEGDDQDWIKMGKLAELAHELSRYTGTLLLTAVQLNRAKPGNGTNNMNNDRVARSAMIGANANFIILIEKRANESELPDFRLHLTKNRRGPLASGVMYKQFECCALHNEPLDGAFASLDMSGQIEDEEEIV